MHGVFGRRAGTVTDYKYSNTLEGSDIVWTDETIDLLFDLGPDHYIPGTKMPMQRITKQQDRDDLIAYLRTATGADGGKGMKAMLSAFAAIVVIAVGANLALNNAGFSAAEQSAGDAVRLD